MGFKTGNKQSFGKIGEEYAARFLTERGYEILARNYRVGRLGEIDIIAREGEYICFVEVKTRSSRDFGSPSEAVTRKKQQSIIRLAEVFMKNPSFQNCCARFDIVEVIVSRSENSVLLIHIHLIKNAFIAG